jgi:TonB family protein
MKAEKVIQEKIEEIQAEQEPMQEKQEEVSALKMPQEKTNDSAHELEELLEPIDLNDVTFVGIQDLQHLELQQLVATELAKHWKRPLGMDQKACIVKVEINKAGNVTTVVIEKSSGVPVFDLSAKAAALKASYPKEIWNKKLAIQF